MAITPKPKSASRGPASVDVEALINKGGSTPSKPSDSKEETPIVLRLPTAMLERIDALVKARPLKTPRHRWILEAVHEKLLRESESTI